MLDAEDRVGFQVDVKLLANGADFNLEETHPEQISLHRAKLDAAALAFVLLDYLFGWLRVQVGEA